MRNAVRANYEVNGESKSMDFIGDNAESSLYQWIQEISRDNDTFKYLGRSDVPNSTKTVIEVQEPEDNIFIPKATKPKPNVTLAEIIGNYEPEEDLVNELFEKDGFIMKKPVKKPSAFEYWFRQFIEEKDLPEVTYSISHPAYIDVAMTNYDVVEIIIEQATPVEQLKVKDVLVQIDFANGDINHFFEHLAEGYVHTLGVRD